MPRVAKPRVFRSTQTSPNSGNVEDLTTAAGSADSRSGTAAYLLGGTAATYRWNPRAASAAVAVPAVDTAAAGIGWRDTLKESATETPAAAGSAGTLRGQVLPTLIAGETGFGSRFDFDGVDRDELSSGIDLGTGFTQAANAPFTWDCRFRRDRQNVVEMLIGGHDGDFAKGLQQLYVDGANNKLTGNICNSAGVAISLTSSAAVANGEHTARLAYDGTTLYLYLDGTRQGTVVTDTRAIASTLRFWVGRNGDLAAGVAPYPFDGAIDEVRRSDLARSTGTSYTVDTAPFSTDANTLGLWHADSTYVVEASGTDQTRYDAGTWTVRVRVDKDGQTVPANITVRVTAILYRVTTAGVHVAEIGRVVMADTTIATTVVAITGSFTTGATITFDAGDKIQAEVYVTHITAGLPAAPAAAVNVHFNVDAAPTVSPAQITAIPGYQLLYARAGADSAPAGDAVTRRTTQARSVPDSAPAADAVTRVGTYPRALGDTAPASDAVTRRTTQARAVADSAPAADTVARRTTQARSVADNAPAADAVTRRTTQSRSTADSAPAADAVTRVYIAARSLADSAPAADSVARRFTGSRSLTDLAPAADAVSRILIQVRNTADNIGPTGGGGGGPVTEAEMDAIAARVWDTLTAAARTAGSYGERVRTNLDTTVSSRAAAVELATVAANVSTILTRVDVATSTRASAADITSLLADVTTLLGRLSAVRAAMLDNLDATISSRASAAQVQVIDDLVDDLEARLTAARALLLDNLNVAVSTRATPADVNVTISADPQVGVR